jgi:hypothetical protein
MKRRKRILCNVKDRRDQRQSASRIFLKFGKPCCLVFIFMPPDFLERGIIIAPQINGRRAMGSVGKIFACLIIAASLAGCAYEAGRNGQLSYGAGHAPSGYVHNDGYGYDGGYGYDSGYGYNNGYGYGSGYGSGYSDSGAIAGYHNYYGF